MSSAWGALDDGFDSDPLTPQILKLPTRSFNVGHSRWYQYCRRVASGVIGDPPAAVLN